MNRGENLLKKKSEMKDGNEGENKGEGSAQKELDESQTLLESLEAEIEKLENDIEKCDSQLDEQREKLNAVKEKANYKNAMKPYTAARKLIIQHDAYLCMDELEARYNELVSQNAQAVTV